MKVKPIYIIVALLGFGFLYMAIKMENDAFDRCMEELPYKECVRIFG
jgi:hypothetical protein